MASNTSPRSHRDLIADLMAGDARFAAAESAAIASLALWGVFGVRGGELVDGQLTQAFEMAYPGLAADVSLAEHFQALQESGDAAVTGFMSGLKGKLAEIRAQEQLEQAGWTDIKIAADPTTPVWDIRAINDSGEEVLFQVKSGSVDYADAVGSAMGSHPDVHFLVSSEIHNQLASSSSPEMLQQATSIGPDYELVEGMQEGLEVLSDGLGIDVPSELLGVLPIAGSIIWAWGLIRTVRGVRRDFADADRTAANKIAVVRTLTVFSRFGVKAVLATSAGVSGGSLGGPVGALVGTGGGIWLAWWANRKLEPPLLEIGLKFTGLTENDIFYYKNKKRFDSLVQRYAEVRRMAATA